MSFAIALREQKGYNKQKFSGEEEMFNNKVYHKIDALSGSVATLRAEGVKYYEIAEIESRAGT